MSHHIFLVKSLLVFIPILIASCSNGSSLITQDQNVLAQDKTVAQHATTSHRDEIIIIPARIDKTCRNGSAKLYDECTDQRKLLKQAQKLAVKENKILLVSYGAEWCIWCHVFSEYIHGATSKFTYTYGSPEEPEARYTATLYEREKRDVTTDAHALSSYVEKSFIFLHIESRYAPHSTDVLKMLGVNKNDITGIPFIFSINKNTGKIAGSVSHDFVEKRRDTDDWYRGYDRKKLLQELTRLYKAASK